MFTQLAGCQMPQLVPRMTQGGLFKPRPVWDRASLCDALTCQGDHRWGITPCFRQPHALMIKNLMRKMKRALPASKGSGAWPLPCCSCTRGYRTGALAWFTGPERMVMKRRASTAAPPGPRMPTTKLPGGRAHCSPALLGMTIDYLHLWTT